MSLGATRTSIRVPPCCSTSRTSTASTSSTKDLTTISTASLIASGGSVLSFWLNRGLLLTAGLDQLTNGLGRLRAFFYPIPNAVHVQLNFRRFACRIVGAEILEIGTIAF